MNISLKNNDADNSGILKIEIVKADYADKVEKNVRNLRQKVALPGFRKGMVPLAMMKKMHGAQVLVEEINKLVSESLFGYIQENKLKLLGEPMPNMTEQKELNFEAQEDFEFCFDLALAPTIKISLNKKDKLTYYNVFVEEEMLDKQIDSYRSTYADFDEIEDVIQENDLVRGIIAELENGLPKEGGLVVEQGILSPSYMKNEEEKAKFVGANKNSVVVFNPKKAYDGVSVEVASLLNVTKEQAESIESDFSFQIESATRRADAELNQTLFDKVFGEGVVTSEEDFRLKVKELLLDQFVPQSNFKFLLDSRELLVKKAGDPVFADDILKRWLVETGNKKTIGEIEENYPKLIEDLKYQLAKESLLEEYDIQVEDADVEGYTERIARSQFAQYGMTSVPREMLNGYVKDILKKKDTLQNMIERTIEEKLCEKIKSLVKLDTKDISIEDFNKLFE